MYYSDELYHHGTKGQKWGVRRYQNPDGSLTVAGRARYLKQSVQRSWNLRKARKAKAKKAEERKKIQQIKKFDKNNPRHIDKHKELYTTEELNKAHTRYQAEKQLSSDAADKLENTRKKIETARQWIDTSVNVYKSVKSVMDIMKKPKKAAPSASQVRAKQILDLVKDKPTDEIDSKWLNQVTETTKKISELEDVSRGKRSNG